MAGSLVWFPYTTNDGNDFAHLGDESNGRATGQTPLTTIALAAQPLDAIPRNIRPRYATYANNARTITRRVVIGSETATAASIPQTLEVSAGPGSAAPGDPTGNADVTLGLIGFSAERKRLVLGIDTGLNDGTP